MAKHKDYDVLVFIRLDDEGIEYFVPYNLKVWNDRLKGCDVVGVCVGEKYEYLISIIHLLNKHLEHYIGHTLWGKKLSGDPDMLKKFLATKLNDVVKLRREEEGYEELLSRATKDMLSQEVGVKD